MIARQDVLRSCPHVNGYLATLAGKVRNDLARNDNDMRDRKARTLDARCVNALRPARQHPAARGGVPQAKCIVNLTPDNYCRFYLISPPICTCLAKPCFLSAPLHFTYPTKYGCAREHVQTYRHSRINSRRPGNLRMTLVSWPRCARAGARARALARARGGR